MTGRQIAVSRAQQDSMHAFLSRQEAQSARFDAVLTTWSSRPPAAPRSDSRAVTAGQGAPAIPRVEPQYRLGAIVSA